MEMKLADNIRKLRKERSLTQEQLAEVLGVTTGAVYKWEAKLSIPEIELIMEMADLFDTSVDVLLGYEMKDNRFEATVKRLREYRLKKDRAGLAEAEKAIKKYPHSFKIVRECAVLYLGFGLESGDREMLFRALELSERSRLLLEQNTDPTISEQTIYGEMALTYLALDETDKATGLLKTHNAGGLFNHVIGHALSHGKDGDEALLFLSESLMGIIGEMMDTVLGYVNVYQARGDHASAQAIIRLGIGFFSALRDDGKPNYLDKATCGLLASLAASQFLAGQAEESKGSLEEAMRLAKLFDRAPSYDVNDIRFVDRIEGAGAYDDIGETAAKTVENVVQKYKNTAFTALWRSVSGKENEE